MDFEVKCRKCGHQADYPLGQIDGLEDQLSQERLEERADVEAEFEGYCHPDELSFGSSLADLARAVRRRDWQEAELLIERIAAESPLADQHQTQCALFGAGDMPRAA